jgi:hypothetical protein
VGAGSKAWSGWGNAMLARESDDDEERRGGVRVTA